MHIVVEKGMKSSNFDNICRLIRDSNDIVLDLSGSYFTSDQIKAIFKELARNPRITHLTMKSCHLAPTDLVGDDDIGFFLFEQLKENQTLRHMDLSENDYYSGEAAKALRSALEKNNKLQELILSPSHLDKRLPDFLLAGIILGLKKNETLKKITVKQAEIFAETDPLSHLIKHPNALISCDLTGLTLAANNVTEMDTMIRKTCNAISLHPARAKTIKLWDHLEFKIIIPDDPLDDRRTSTYYEEIYRKGNIGDVFDRNIPRWKLEIKQAFSGPNKKMEFPESTKAEPKPSIAGMFSTTGIEMVSVSSLQDKKDIKDIKEDFKTPAVTPIIPEKVKPDLSAAYGKLVGSRFGFSRSKLNELTKEEILSAFKEWLQAAIEHQKAKGDKRETFMARRKSDSDESAKTKRGDITETLQRIQIKANALDISKLDYFQTIKHFIDEIDGEIKGVHVDYKGATVIKELIQLKEYFEQRFPKSSEDYFPKAAVAASMAPPK